MFRQQLYFKQRIFEHLILNEIGSESYIFTLRVADVSENVVGAYRTDVHTPFDLQLQNMGLENVGMHLGLALKLAASRKGNGQRELRRSLKSGANKNERRRKTLALHPKRRGPASSYPNLSVLGARAFI